MVGTGRGAHAGVLIKDAAALETFEKVDTLVFDKTGTLTEGKPRLVSIVPAAGVQENDVLRLAASLEQGSEHPLAAAIVTAARERGLVLSTIAAFSSTPGHGVTGRIDGKEIGVATAANETGFADEISALRGEGQTVMTVMVDGKPAGVLGVTDRVKESTPAAVKALRDAGLRLVLLSGDNRIAATAVGRSLGIDRIEAEVSPANKAQVIRRLQDEGRVVAMAGDGVNDAPALAQAHVGIAMGTGADVAIQSAGITLLRGDLQGLVRARRLSRATLRNIRQNLFFAFIYNVVGVPVAAGILYPFTGLLLSPMLAAAAMTFSSVSVIGNALRLRNAKL
jgi:Cu+-exporting ATPase